MKHLNPQGRRQRLILVLLVGMVLMQLVPMFGYAQNLGGTPQLNKAVQGQTAAQPEGAFLNFVSQGPNCVTGFESDCKAGIAWFVIRPHFGEDGLRAEVRRQGYISVQGENVFFPSVAVGDDGRGVVAFALSGRDFFPSTAFARISHNGTGPVRIAAAGVAPEDGFSGYAAFGGAGSGRWGDYSAAAVVDENTIWFATEFIPGGVRVALANWGTFIARVQADENED